MEKHIYNEQTGISYTLHVDYYLPDLTLSNEEKGFFVRANNSAYDRDAQKRLWVLFL